MRTFSGIEESTMKKCIHCGKEIENDSDFCFYCGTAQNTKGNEERKSEIPFFKATVDHENNDNQVDESTTSLVTKIKREDNLKNIEDNVDHLEEAIQESEKSNKRKKRNIIIAVIASILVITSIMVSIASSNKRLVQDRKDRIAQRNNVSTEAETTEPISKVEYNQSTGSYTLKITYPSFRSNLNTNYGEYLAQTQGVERTAEIVQQATDILDTSIKEYTSSSSDYYNSKVNVYEFDFARKGNWGMVRTSIEVDPTTDKIVHISIASTDSHLTDYHTDCCIMITKSLGVSNSTISGLMTYDEKDDVYRCTYQGVVYEMLTKSGVYERMDIYPELTKTGVESETVSAKDDRKTYFTDYSVVLPDDWTYEDHGDSVDFHSKYSYENDIQENLYGRIFTIEKTKLTESDYMEAVKLLGTKDGYNYFVVYPTGMGVSNDETANQTHSAALAEKEDVINSFELISTTNKESDTESSTKFSSDPNEIIEESPQYGKLRFTFTYKELYSRQQNALTKLGLKGSKQYDWDLDDLQISDEHYKWSHEDLETMLYQYICKDESYYWWEYIYCTKYEESNLVRGFEICVKSRQGADQITVIKNIVKISLLMINPNLTVEQAESAMNQLYNSPDSFNTDRCMYYNGVFYRLAGKEDFTGVVVKPMTESDYQKSIDKKNTN